MSEQTPVEPKEGTEDKRFNRLKEQVELLKQQRVDLDPLLDDINFYVRQNTHVEGGFAQFRDQRSRNEIFDPTAPWAAVQAANGLGSYLTSSTDRWMKVSAYGRRDSELSRRSRMVLEEIEDRLFYEYSRPEVGFGTATSEVYLDVVTMATAVQFIDWDDGGKHLRMIPYSIKNCYPAENIHRRVDTLFRESSVTVRQIKQMFPQAGENPAIRHKNETDTVDLWHGVFPNKDRDIYRVGKDSMPYSSVYFSCDLQEIFEEGGYWSFPYQVPRWMRVIGDVYGQGPAMQCFSAILNANQIMEEIHISARLANRPPMTFDEDSILLPMGQQGPEFVPGSLLPKVPGSESPEPVLSGSQPQYDWEILRMQQQWITQAFHVSHLLREQKKERQSVTEIMDERTEMLRQLGSVLGRLQQEYLGPMASRSIDLLRRQGELPELTDELAEGGLDIGFTNPAAKAQLGTKAQGMSAYLQDLGLIAQAKPEVMDVIDPVAWAEEMANLRDVSPKVLRSRRELEDRWRGQQEAAQAQRAAEAAPGVAKAAKDVADARQTDPMVRRLLSAAG